MKNQPILYDVYSGAGGAALGYSQAGFRVVGIDSHPQPHYPFPFIQMDAFRFFAAVKSGEYPMPDAWHCSPPCQSYSIMHNLPWLRAKVYPVLILPTLEFLETTGRPYVLENVMGARHGAKGLSKRGLEDHGLKAGWLCGTMFGKPFYRHRLFATNFLWLAPGHPKHMKRIRPSSSLVGRAKDIVFSASEDSRGIESWPGRRGQEAGSGLTLRAFTRKTGKVEYVTKTGTTEPGYGLTQWQNNGAQTEGVGIGHAKGWRKAAGAMDITWMGRDELTQAIPPIYTRFLGEALMREVVARKLVGA